MPNKKQDKQNQQKTKYINKQRNEKTQNHRIK